MPPLSLGPPVVRPFKTTVVRPGGNLTRIFLAQTVPAIKSIPASTKSETRFIDCPFRTELTNVKTDTLWIASVSSQLQPQRTQLQSEGIGSVNGRYEVI